MSNHQRKVEYFKVLMPQPHRESVMVAIVRCDTIPNMSWSHVCSSELENDPDVLHELFRLWDERFTDMDDALTSLGIHHPAELAYLGEQMEDIEATTLLAFEAFPLIELRLDP